MMRRYNVLKFLLKGITAFGLIIFFIYGSAGASDPFTEMGVIRPRVRVEAPAFNLRDINGVRRGLTDFKGKVILLNFWATWCPHCREDMPSLERLWKKFKAKGVVVIAVAVDRNHEVVESFVRRLGLTFPILLGGDGPTRRAYEVTALPMTYIIGKDQRISGRLFGSKDWTDKDADALMKDLLRQ
jgi:peroxiredoxin